jgi:hypothetical protein
MSDEKKVCKKVQLNMLSVRENGKYCKFSTPQKKIEMASRKVIFSINFFCRTKHLARYVIARLFRVINQISEKMLRVLKKRKYRG